MSEYHIPVMFDQCLKALNIQPDGTYVDATFGGGGHSKGILQYLNKGHLYAFDQDLDAAQQAASIQYSSFHFIDSNFRFLKQFLRAEGVKQVDGLLADLGVSSHQFDQADRGFSIRFDAALDMRMNQQQPLSALQVLNEYTESELHKLLGMYGEITNAKTLAHALIRQRSNKKLQTIADLREAAIPLAPKGKENKYLAQVFQAIRIEVNQELEALKDLLTQAAEVIKPGGRLVIMSYHSLEDRLVKNFIAQGKFFGEAEKDVYGNVSKPFDAVFRKAVEASEEEVAVNPRARSAKLRVAERI
ncbi:MAG: 16S rRNA (cytosine(1402)-N(4))-methyltransferase RsmH [Cytophagaceae bacterium]|jgi:16S rRNA (cytosine1402-N4)-methyltransferase|nr:16S rRNA (cytosine(1402)-N(4))-methyltransferase RsmH [Cytophagaceae bacterium]